MLHFSDYIFALLLQGTVWYSMFKWSVVANLTSSLGYDASSLGNHEFDDGVNDIEAFSDAIKDSYPMLACNLDMSRVPELQKIIKPYILKEFRGETIAIVGYVTPDTKELSDTGNVEFIDEVTSLRQTVKELKNQNIKIIVALGHSGYTKDLEIAEKVSLISLVFTYSASNLVLQKLVILYSIDGFEFFLKCK